MPTKTIPKINVPGSKSITNRAILMASLSGGKCILRNPLFSDDTKMMIEALKEIGIKIEKNKKDLIIHGKLGTFRKAKKELFLGNAGTAMRFLTAISCLVPGKTITTGDSRMQERPIQDLINGLNKLDINAKSINDNKCPPIEIPFQEFKGGICEIKGSQSSQYISAILMLAPLSQHKDTIINIKGKLVSKPYIDMTLKLLERFGIKVENKKYKTFKIKAKQKYKTIDLEIEGDASSATYFLGLAAATNKEISITNVGVDSIQGDAKFYKILEKMGCEILATKEYISVRGPKKLKSIGEINMNEMPDASITLAVLASITEGISTITGIKNLRIKECNRIEALVKQFRKCGIYAKELPDGIKIIGRPPRNTEIETYNDHRIAMSFAILSKVNPEITILNPECVKKSYPNFWKDFAKI